MENNITLQSSSDFIKINVSNSKNESVAFELKFSKSLTLAELKGKLEIITGGNAASMKLELYNGDRFVANLVDDVALLGSLPIDTGMRIHVVDNFAWVADENVEKFELSEEAYERKGDTVRSFLKNNRVGKYNEEEMRQKEEERRQQSEHEQQRAELCTIGSRCQVSVAGNPTRRGTIMYNGPLDGKKGIFIGVKYDEPLGKNNGSFDGKVYFVCQPKYGGFVSPMNVSVGNFPPEDVDLEDEI